MTVPKWKASLGRRICLRQLVQNNLFFLGMFSFWQKASHLRCQDLSPVSVLFWMCPQQHLQMCDKCVFYLFICCSNALVQKYKCRIIGSKGLSSKKMNNLVAIKGVSPKLSFHLAKETVVLRYSSGRGMKPFVFMYPVI